MKKTAILYTRVSTDEQAEKGYSLQYQLERLHKYCAAQNIEPAAHFQEDFSAKTFDRPAFKKLLQFCKTNKGTIHYILFLNWSRFSRNAGDSYSMIREFQKLGIEPQAIEQPLDLSIPENKMMLAFYLAAPEVENDRRSMNVRSGMYRARKEGRFLGNAPRGYKNGRDASNKPIIVPHEVDGPLVVEAFEECARQNHSVENIRREMCRRGLNIPRSTFPELLRNRIYIGEIFVSGFKEEPGQHVKGIHQPLITSELFEEVQAVLDGRAYKRPTKNTAKEELPLRGFLQCRACGGLLTGSASRGNGGKYFYYHCQKGCPERFKALDANRRFEEYLSYLKPRPEVADLYEVILKDVFKNSSNESLAQVKKLDEDMSKSRSRVQKMQGLLLEDKISPEDYKEMKSSEEQKIAELNRQKNLLISVDEDCTKYIETSCNLIKNMDVAYHRADLELKHLIIGSIFPGKLIFEENEYRTNRLNEVVSLLCLGDNELQENKKGNSNKKFEVSRSVAPTGIEPVSKV